MSFFSLVSFSAASSLAFYSALFFLSWKFLATPPEMQITAVTTKIMIAIVASSLSGNLLVER
jgi:hypothetical protein